MYNNLNKYTVYTLKDIDYWIDDFEKAREQILRSDDAKRINYSSKNFILKDQEEISVVYYDDELVSFSTIFGRPKFYPKNTYRVLNRSWKNPNIRWRKPPYYILSSLMLKPQIKKAKELNAKAVFVSSEGHRNRWLKSWIEGANKEYKNWVQVDGMVKVCGGAYLKCWQNVGYLPLVSGYTPNFDTVSYKEWEKLIAN